MQETNILVRAKTSDLKSISFFICPQGYMSTTPLSKRQTAFVAFCVIYARQEIRAKRAGSKGKLLGVPDSSLTDIR
eukprot:m.219264 g.219264  ORF g.219264 m.219264 type:complete len:76 (+) comp39921_c0_seq20:1761-1988(+)